MRTRFLTSVLVLVLLAAYFLGGIGYLKQRQQNERLTMQVAAAARNLAQFPRPAPDLEERLATAQAKLTEVESHLPSRVNSTETINAILKLADETGVKAIPMVTQPWRVEKTGKHSYYVLRMNLSVKGTFAQVVELAQRLESGAFPSLIIRQLSSTRRVEPSIEKGEDASAVPLSVILELAIYAGSAPGSPGVHP